MHPLSCAELSIENDKISVLEVEAIRAINYVWIITNLVMLQEFEVLSGKFNVVGICTSETHKQEWNINYIIFNSSFWRCSGTCCNVIGWGTVLQAGRLWVQFPMRSLDFSVDVILPASTMALGWTGCITEMSTRNVPEGYGWVSSL
jgi:hypothetical protein